MKSIDIYGDLASLLHTFIGRNAFENCTSIKSAKIDAICEICEAAFCNCTSLQTVRLKDVYTIDKNAFEGCKNLKEVFMDYETVEIDDSAFAGCPNVVIKCNKYTYAYNFAKRNGIKYNCIDEDFYRYVDNNE